MKELVLAGMCFISITLWAGVDEVKINHKKALILEKMCKVRDRKFDNIKHITVKNYLRNPQNWIFVDVRPENERNISIIPGAITPLKIEANPELYRNKYLLIYCTVGDRSLEYVEKLKSKGFKHAANLRGGVLKWAESGQKFIDQKGKNTTKVHVYGKKWNLLPSGYEGVW